MQRNIGDLHGTRLGLEMMEARLKSMRNMWAEKVNRGEDDEMQVGRP
jgi:hypothetical protein